MVARVLIIAGSDSSAGAGVQADLKTVSALGGYAATAITAVTVQNTLGVSDVHPIPPQIVAAQIKAVVTDLGADVIKTGMLVNAEVVAAVADMITEVARDTPRIVDPVLRASAGQSLLAGEALAVLRTRLIKGARLVTPNLPEAAALTGRTIATEADMHAAVADLRALGAEAVLLKGGHLAGDVIVDLLITHDDVVRFEGSRIPGRATHGTGCTLASAIAVGLAQGMALKDAVLRAREFVRTAIATAPALGLGTGPLNHGFLTQDRGGVGAAATRKNAGL